MKGISMMRNIIGFTIFVILFAGPGSWAKVESLTMTEMIHLSRLIIIGRVITIVEPVGEKSPAKGIATIEIEEIIRGTYGENEIKIVYSPSSAPSAHFVIGQRCVFFIKSINNANYIVQAYAGQIPIEDERVRVLFISGEKKDQPLVDFIKRIKEIR